MVSEFDSKNELIDPQIALKKTIIFHILMSLNNDQIYDSRVRGE